jgi:small GTP-binding protein
MLLQRKVCALGAFGVGKTSLVRRYVESIFSETYLTTVGVKIDKRAVELGPKTLTLILWDLAGEDETTPIRTSHLRGSAGYFLVADGTRAETIAVAQSIHARVKSELGPLPFVFLLNKVDLQDDWEVPASAESTFENEAVAAFTTSAKTGAGVEEAFQQLAQRIVF